MPKTAHTSFENGGNGMYPFFAMLSRMKYINRWGLMRNTRCENICEHSLEVALVAHALATIGNKKFGKHYDPERAAMLAVLHDASEIITGIILFFILSSEFFINYRVIVRGGKEAKGK